MVMCNEHIPNEYLRQRVSDLAVAGIPLYLIAEVIELNEETIKKHYRRELAIAEPITIERVAKTVVMQALEGNEKSQALYMKTKGAKFGWVEKQIIETTDSKDTQAMREKIAELEISCQRDF